MGGIVPGIQYARDGGQFTAQTQTPGISLQQLPQFNPAAGGGMDFTALLQAKLARQAQQDRDAREMRQIALIQQGKDSDFQDQQRFLMAQQQREAAGRGRLEDQYKLQMLAAEARLKDAASRPLPRSVQGFSPQVTPGYMTDYSQVPQGLLPKESTTRPGGADTIASVGGYGSPTPNLNSQGYGVHPAGPGQDLQGGATAGEGPSSGAGPSPQEAMRRAGIMQADDPRWITPPPPAQQ